MADAAAHAAAQLLRPLPSSRGKPRTEFFPAKGVSRIPAKGRARFHVVEETKRQLHDQSLLLLSSSAPSPSPLPSSLPIGAAATAPSTPAVLESSPGAAVAVAVASHQAHQAALSHRSSRIPLPKLRRAQTPPVTMRHPHHHRRHRRRRRRRRGSRNTPSAESTPRSEYWHGSRNNGHVKRRRQLHPQPHHRGENSSAERHERREEDHHQRQKQSRYHHRHRPPRGGFPSSLSSPTLHPQRRNYRPPQSHDKENTEPVVSAAELRRQHDLRVRRRRQRRAARQRAEAELALKPVKVPPIQIPREMGLDGRKFKPPLPSPEHAPVSHIQQRTDFTSFLTMNRTFPLRSQTTRSARRQLHHHHPPNGSTSNSNSKRLPLDRALPGSRFADNGSHLQHHASMVRDTGGPRARSRSLGKAPASKSRVVIRKRIRGSDVVSADSKAPQMMAMLGSVTDEKGGGCDIDPVGAELDIPVDDDDDVGITDEVAPVAIEVQPSFVGPDATIEDEIVEENI